MSVSDLFRKWAGKPAREEPAAVLPRIKPASIVDVAQSPDAAATASSVFTVDPAKMFDLEGTGRLAEVFTTPRLARDEAWTARFFEAVWNASLQVGTPAVFQGPDYFAYVRVQLPAPAVAFDSNCVANLAAQAVDRTMGIAVFSSAQATEPEFVLSMGVLDSLLLYGSWRGDPIDLADLAAAGQQQGASGIQTSTLKTDQQVLVGSPSATFLPAHTARALHRHLAEGWKIAEPRVALLVNPALAPTRNLVINRRLAEFPNRETADRQGQMLRWYLPPKRGLLLMPDGWEEKDMLPLTNFFPEPTKGQATRGAAEQPAAAEDASR